MENEEIVLKKPYFDVEYLDDDNIKHLGVIQNEENLNYIKERFTLLESRKVS